MSSSSAHAVSFVQCFIGRKQKKTKTKRWGIQTVLKSKLLGRDRDGQPQGATLTPYSWMPRTVKLPYYNSSFHRKGWTQMKSHFPYLQVNWLKSSQRPCELPKHVNCVTLTWARWQVTSLSEAQAGCWSSHHEHPVGSFLNFVLQRLYTSSVWKQGMLQRGRSNFLLPHIESQNKTDHFWGGGLCDAGQSLTPLPHSLLGQMFAAATCAYSYTRNKGLKTTDCQKERVSALR